MFNATMCVDQRFTVMNLGMLCSMLNDHLEDAFVY